jgi:hypothetical protein
MSSRDVLVVDFPVGKEISDAERAQRVMTEATRLASLTPGEWKIWYQDKAKQFGIRPELFAELVQAQIKDREQKDREKQAEARLEEQRAERLRKTEGARQREQQRIDDAAKSKAKEKSKTFADIIKLPSDQHEAKLAALAKKLDEDVTALRAEFAEYCGAEGSSSSVPMSEWDEVEPWPEPIATVVVLEELIARINKHIEAKPHEVLVIALWILMSWVHEAAAHYSVYLVATSPKENCGKTTLIIELIGRLVPKPRSSSSDPTIAGIFRTADREKPTMLFDNVDTLFQRKPEVAELFLNGWTKGIKYSRVERIGGEWVTVWFDPFCPKACSLIGTNLPRPLLGRSLLIELWPLKSGEKVDKVNPFDLELMDHFKTLRRKLARWGNDNAAAVKDAKPLVPAAFISRPADNWTLLWAIAELAGDDWAKQARAAAERLSQDELVEPSWLDLLLQELWIVFVEDRRKDVTSKQLVARLTAETSPWRDYGRGHPVTQREVAASLRKLRIRPCLVGKARVGADFFEKEIFQHFLGRDPLILSPDTEKKSRRSRRKKMRG